MITNAIKFTHDGYILVTYTHEQIPGDITVLHFVIEDTGIGMTTEEQSRLFKPFSQANSSILKKIIIIFLLI